MSLGKAASAGQVDVVWDSSAQGVYSDAFDWMPHIVPNNGNAGDTYRVTVANRGPTADMDVSVDSFTLTGNAYINLPNHLFVSAVTRNDTSPFALSKDSYDLEGVNVSGYSGVGKANLGNLANFDRATNTLAGGSYSASGYDYDAIISFDGARIVRNAAGIRLGFKGKITDEFGSDALQPLAVNDGVLDLQEFHTAGDFTNNGELNLISHDISPRLFVVTGKLTNFDPKTKTLTGGRYVLTDPSYHGYVTRLQFPGADIVNNAGDIYAARMRDDSPNSAPSIVDEHGNDALRNIANNAAGGRITFVDFGYGTNAPRLTNAGYMYFGAPFTLPPGGVFEQSGGELGLNLRPGPLGGVLNTQGGSIQLNGGRLTGGGRLIGTTFSNAVIAPGEFTYQPVTTFEGSLTLGPASVLRFDIAGLIRGPGSPSRPTSDPVLGYDAIDCTGSMSIDGKLQVATTIIPAPDKTFVVVQAQTPITGSFSNVANGARLTTTDGRGSFVVNYGPNTTFDPKAVVLSNFQPNTNPAILLNLSSRGTVASGQRAMIGGFIITGSEPKPVLVRALGPSMRSAGVAGVLEDPMLSLHNASGATIRSNDNWQQSDQRTDIQATGIPPGDPREAAIVATLPPGNYTAVLEGKDGKSGVALVEIYDLDASAQSQLANISTRGYVGTGDNALIGGVIIAGGTGDTDVVLRALGPSLSAAGVTEVLSNPYLYIADQKGVALEGNDDWKMNEAAIRATGIPPSNDLESAIARTLQPGAYTAVVQPAIDPDLHTSSNGVGLVEFYRLR